MQDGCAILQKAGGAINYKLLIFKGIIDNSNYLFITASSGLVHIVKTSLSAV